MASSAFLQILLEEGADAKERSKRARAAATADNIEQQIEKCLCEKLLNTSIKSAADALRGSGGVTASRFVMLSTQAWLKYRYCNAVH